MVFKSPHRLTPDYINDLLTNCISKRPLCSADSLTLIVPRLRTKLYAEAAFSSYDPRLWTSLSIESRICTSLTTFKRKVKTHLLENAFT